MKPLGIGLKGWSAIIFFILLIILCFAVLSTPTLSKTQYTFKTTLKIQEEKPLLWIEEVGKNATSCIISG